MNIHFILDYWSGADNLIINIQCITGIFLDYTFYLKTEELPAKQNKINLIIWIKLQMYYLLVINSNKIT